MHPVWSHREGGRRTERVNENQCSLLSGCGCWRESHFNLKITVRWICLSNCFYVDIQHRGGCPPSESCRKQRRSQSMLAIRRMVGRISSDSSVLMQINGGAHRVFCGSQRMLKRKTNQRSPSPLTSGFSSSMLVAVVLVVVVVLRKQE